VLTLLVLLTPLSAADKPVPTAEAAARMTVPPGFTVTLFAGEPDVVQPIAFTFDDRGRMWVVECLSYPKWRSDGKGSDRVVILEDTDGDGRHDKKTVFLDDGCNLSGIELGFGGVYLCSTPNLIFIPVKDDKPAGPPQVLLDGWNLKEAKHNAFNGLAWGPDGWLYGTNGIQSKSWVGRPGEPREKRTYLDCGVWRYHPTRHTFEVFAHGTTNPWGVDWDEHGELLVTNCVIDHLFHFAPGGHYRRMHGQDANPFSYALMGAASTHKHWGAGHWTDARADKATGAVGKELSDLGGGHAHCGICVYLGDQFPAEYRNTVFMCNIHGNRLNNDGLVRTPTGPKGVRRPDFLFANDPWFRGVAVKQGPDGSLYVADWCDTGECHNYDVADTTNGRIYKVTYGKPKRWAVDVAKMTDDELVAAQRGRNEWLVRQARRVMQERAAAGRLEPNTPPALRSALVTAADDRHALRVGWALAAVGQLTAADAMHLLARESDSVRAWGVRLAAQQPDPGPVASGRLAQMAATDASPFVRLQLAAALQRMQPKERLPLASKLLTRAEDNADHNLSLMYWYAVQPAVIADPEGAVALAAKTPIRVVRQYVARHLIDQPGTDESGRIARAVSLLAAVADDDARQDVLTGMRDALAGRRSLAPPADWLGLYPKLGAGPSEAVAELADEVALRFGDERAVTRLLATADNTTVPADRRRRAIDRLATVRQAEVAAGLKKWLTDPAVRGAAVRALAAYPDADTPTAILTAYPFLTPAERADAVQTLATRPAFALALLAAVERGSVPKADITAFTARQLQALNDKAVSTKLAQVWGTVRNTGKDKAAFDKYRALLAPDAVKAADRSLGRAVFARQCAACHKMFGEGGDVGPELTGSQRANLDYVLENVLDPNAVVPYDAKMTAFALTDGRVLTGLVRKETDTAVTIRTVNEEVTVAKADIDSRKATDLSVMPEGLFDQLTPAEVRALVAYLASPEQVPVKR
jgi:putative membrane-bound dehydrogenase-like protein